MRGSTRCGVVGVLLLGLGLGGCSSDKGLRKLAHETDFRTPADLRAEGLLKRAEQQLDEGDRQGAATNYMAALEERPDLYAAHLGLGTLYDLEGDQLAALAEYGAYTEVVPRARMTLDLMLPYHEGKFARDPVGPQDISKEKRALAVLELSLAVVDRRAGRLDQALERLRRAYAGLPRSGLPEYLAGMIELEQGHEAPARESFDQAVAHNGYFARRLLADRVDQRLPGLLERLRELLGQALEEHPADALTARLAAVVDFRLGAPERALKTLRQAQGWGEKEWEALFLKALVLDRLGQRVESDQALADILVLKLDLSQAFTLEEASLFHGPLAGQADAFALEHLAPALPEPARAYFRWRLRAEAGDPTAADERAAFERASAEGFPAGALEDVPGKEPPALEPRSRPEYLGAVDGRLQDAMPAFNRCDATRRSLRSNPSARMLFRLQLDATGVPALVAVLENTTDDSPLAYCVVRKLLQMRFPKSRRTVETFKLPIMLGPEVDGLLEKGAGR
jgi:tetratricopeptide (TPR) repeat protein